MKTRISLFLLCFVIVFSLKSQSKDVSYTIHSSTGLSSDTTLPFWLVANQYGAVPNSDYGLLNTAIFKELLAKAYQCGLQQPVRLLGIGVGIKNQPEHNLQLSILDV